ncbi:Rpn family recombination-promoting nuclease/putative transposase [Escherichia coli]|nr:Rpn family recombination-promoting nuclease/putative transposase [Escherichia coli]
MSEKVNKITMIHDGALKKTLEDPAAVRDFLEQVLTHDQISRCNLDTIEVEKNSFVTESLRQHACDVLISMKTNDGRDGYIYTLIEHQSSPDKFIPLRMMRYILAVMEQHVEKHKCAPVVIPVLFYHGAVRPYPYPLNWVDCLDDPEYGREIYGESKPFSLVDVSTLDDDEIEQYRRMAALMYTMKSGTQGDLIELIGKSITLTDKYGSSVHLNTVLTYLMELYQMDVAELFEAISTHYPSHKGVIMTIAEQLEEKGLEKGRAEGLAEGRAEGRAEERQKALAETYASVRRMSDMGMSTEVIKQALQLSDEQIQEALNN